MKKYRLSLIVMMLAGILLCCPMVFNAEAYAEDGVQAIKSETVTQVNPLYEGMVDESELKVPKKALRAAAGEPEYYGSEDAAGAAIREKLVNRAAQFSVPYKCVIKDSSKIKARAFAIGTNILYNALTHTGDPDEGDALLWGFAGYSFAYGGSYDGQTGECVLIFNYAVTYYTTAAEENDTNNAIDSILAGLELKGKTDYEKITAIYKWECDNIVYPSAEEIKAAEGNDDESLNDYHFHTAYNAAVKKKSVCQGYSALLYRMLLRAGIDTRMVGGVGAVESHVWNIVNIGGKYYLLDATWDAQKTPEQYSNYLKGRSDWSKSGHASYSGSFFDRSRYSKSGVYFGEYVINIFDFQDKYNVQSGNFNADARSACAEGHSWGALTTDRSATCSLNGTKTEHCSVCGDSQNAVIIPRTGHAGVETVAKAATCTEAGTDACWTCSMCGSVFGDEDCTQSLDKNTTVKPALGHSYTTVVDVPAGYLQHGSAQTQCTRCGAVGIRWGLEGYSTSYVKKFKVSKGKKCFTAKWKKQSKTNQKKFSGYQLRYSGSSDMSGAVYKTASKKSKSKKIKKLAKKTYYYVQVRTYVSNGNGTFYSPWSAVKSVKTK